MRLPIWVSTLVAILAVAGIVAPDTPAAGLGSIKGVVRDGSGSPLVGAEVVIVTGIDGLKTEKVIKRASTDRDGRFIAAGILPGHYKVKAEADGFTTVELAAFVKPNKVTVFDSILLRRTATLEDETSMNSDPRYASRAARGIVFHYNDEAADPSPAREPELLAPPANSTHGFVYAFSQSVSGDSGLAGSFPGVDFAISQQLSRSTNVVVSGQTGVGELSPQRLAVQTTTSANERHKVSVAVGYGRFTIARAGVDSQLGQVSLAATDTWQVSGPVVILYGFELDRFAEAGSGTSVLPRLGVALDAAARTKLFADLVPGSTQDIQAIADLETGQVPFADQPPPLAAGANDRLVPDRSYRLQFGGQQVLSENSTLEVMAFFDTISGHAVGLLAIPIDAPESAAEFRSQDQSGASRGMRVVYHRHLAKFLDSSVGYAVGQGQSLSSRGITNPGDLFDDELFQIVAAKLDANFMRTGTKISTVMRMAPSRAIFAIDPFQGEMTAYDPNLSILVTQELPSIRLLPGQWAAILDLRNLLNQQSSVALGGQEIIASQYHRLIRAGVTVRF
jgi:hypothetical protein